MSSPDPTKTPREESDEMPGNGASKLLTWVAGLGSLGIVASVGMLVDTGQRLSRIEGSIEDNKAERLSQMTNLERRIERLEDESRRNGRNER